MNPVGDVPTSGERSTRKRADSLLSRYLARFDDGEVLRWAFRGLAIGAIGVLAMDLRDLTALDEQSQVGTELTETGQPVLPPAVRMDTPGGTTDPRPFLTTSEETLQQPMIFSLEPGGVLTAVGSIEAGTAARFAAEIETRGEYVKSLSLNSPGGLVEDAMAMARIVRERGIATLVADGALCASSCPLLFAGGDERIAGKEAAIGVHQVYAMSVTEDLGRDQVMSDAQATTARISRHLADMGVDPALWLHALDTPPRALYYLSAKELVDYRLVTSRGLVSAG